MSAEKILIIDDNPINLKLVTVLLTLEGYELRAAADATEALDVLRDFAPALILMDIQLPGMDGLSLTRGLKEKPEYKNTIILAVTSFAMRGDEDKALAAGCDGYVTKPIDTHQLPQVIRQYLDQRADKSKG